MKAFGIVRILALVMVLALACSGIALGEAETYDTVKDIKLGTSGYHIVTLSDFQQGMLLEEDIADHQVAYWYSESVLLDFDVYQTPKPEGISSLQDYVMAIIGENTAVTELVTQATINGIPAAWFRTVEAYGEGEYDVEYLTLEDKDSFICVVFWLDGDEALVEADKIVHSLYYEEG
ncbi:MAG: hypothetical protein IJJ23_08690 [Clostridia bacterium]|nr:hypothetical protein [Clostridia bacterium]